MDSLVVTSMRQEFEKVALLERLVRLGATDIPRTPRMLMRGRSQSELAALQHGVSNTWDKRVTNPIMNVAGKGLSRLPAGKVRQLATKGVQGLARDPLGTVATNLVPIPGAFPAYAAGKKGLERLIDRFAPLASTAT
jgi:hypothetical protein